jgi:hypothetical protein
VGFFFYAWEKKGGLLIFFLFSCFMSTYICAKDVVRWGRGELQGLAEYNYALCYVLHYLGVCSDRTIRIFPGLCY